eukprot:TRINITY_DN13573_c0_g1_i2.p1 TRINITY_DN13573_c0_g1~~TRINITY_DN13573_c0_g1_i2.p1  ORF type:complete len:243 (+),score=28.37 TRINITY_DN13573_c0_g1_i2:83-730(+)
MVFAVLGLLVLERTAVGLLGHCLALVATLLVHIVRGTNYWLRQVHCCCTNSLTARNQRLCILLQAFAAFCGRLVSYIVHICAAVTVMIAGAENPVLRDSYFGGQNSTYLSMHIYNHDVGPRNMVFNLLGMVLSLIIFFVFCLLAKKAWVLRHVAVHPDIEGAGMNAAGASDPHDLAVIPPLLAFLKVHKIFIASTMTFTVMICTATSSLLSNQEL